MKDMRGVEVSEDDYLIDDRGKIFIVQSTPPTFLKERLIIVCEFKHGGEGKRGFMREKFALRIVEQVLDDPQTTRRELWKWNYDKYVAPKGREEIRQRREGFQERRGPNKN